MLMRMVRSLPFVFIRVQIAQAGSYTEQPKGEDYVDENGIRTTVEYTINEEGKKVKVRSILPHTTASLLIAEWVDHTKNQADPSKSRCRSQRCGAKALGEVWAGAREQARSGSSDDDCRREC